jgi:hypothetical protein
VPLQLRRLRLPVFLAVLVAALVCAPSALAAGGTQRAPDYVPIRVLVAAGPKPIPLAGAHVRLLKAGKKIAAGKTYGLGLAVATATSRRKIPGHFTVKTSGGYIHGKRYSGRLFGKVRRHGSRPTVVIVNPETTLSVKYCKRHRRLKVRTCQRRVTRFLDLPRGTDLGSDLLGSQALDGRKMLKSAGGARGLPRYLGKLVKKIGGAGSKPVHSFHGTRPHSHVVAPIPELAPLGGAGQGGSSHPGGSFGSFWSFLNSTRTGISLVSQVAGWLFPSGGNTDAQQLANINSALDQINAQLTDLQNEMTAIQQELKQLMDANTYGIYNGLAENANQAVTSIDDAMSSYQTLTEVADEISCGSSTVSATCPNPKSPSAVCAAAPPRGATQLLCQELGLLPAPPASPETEGWWTIQGSPESMTLIGRFMVESTQQNPFNDSDVQALANDVLGAAAGGGPATVGIWQYGSAYLAGQAPFVGTPTDQEIQDIIGYYMSAFTAGLTMRAAYWGFDGDPPSSYEAAFQGPNPNQPEPPGMLPQFQALTNAAPAPLPGGTFIDMKSGLMWSGWLGSQEFFGCTQSNPAPFGLPYQPSCTVGDEHPNGDVPNNAPGAVTPQLAKGQTITDWSQAGGNELESLSTDVAPYANGGSQATYLVNNGLFAGQIISNAFDFSGSSASPMWPNGLDNNFNSCDLLTNAPGTCGAFVWTNGDGAASLPWDMASGGQWTPQPALTFVFAYDLPMLYWRSPTASECYFFLESNLSSCTS